nr:PREDICTED: uncharacterized protein LOC107398277 isoform X1 [Tribolium castaneum]|eukprot:XP_015837320.1 PREDICTED: uncharacterized protein LOC107398277 isoform X1 [Tribolium castaneum]
MCASFCRVEINPAEVIALVFCSIAALMYIFGCKTTKAASILRPSKSFLEEVADFDNIVEPENIQSGNNLETRESGDEEYYDEDCPNGKCPRDADTSTAKSILNKLGSSFLHKFFARDTSRAEDYMRRQLEQEQEKEQRQYDIDPKNDQDFMQEQERYENITNATKQLYNKLEEEQVQLGPLGEENICCEEEEPIRRTFVQIPQKSGIRASNGLLEMHFYEKIPAADSVKIVPHEQPVFINLYPKHEKNRRMESAKKYDYFALVPQDNKLIQVPAVKFTILPEFKRRKKDIYSPYLAKLKRLHPFRHGSNYRHNAHSFSLVDNKMNDDELGSAKLYKRFANLENSNNKYLEEADFLIHNRGISLKSSLDSSSKEKNEEGFNVNQSPVAAAGAKNEAEGGQSLVNTLEGEQRLVDNDNGLSLVDVEGGGQGDSLVGSIEGGGNNLVKSEVSGLGGGQSMVKNEVNGVEEGQGLVKSEVSGLEGGQSMVKNEVSGMGEGQGLVKSEVSGVEQGQGLVKSEVSGMEGGQGIDDSLVKSEVGDDGEFL